MLQSKYLAASGVVFDHPVWYHGCVIERTAANQEASVVAYAGLAPVGDPFWMFTLGKDDPRTVRVDRDTEDPLYIEGGIYATLGAHTRLIAYYRPVGP